MSNGEGNGGGRQPPPDDRTLLDPLSDDELQKLREARQRMQAARKAAASKKSSAIKHQIVIGGEGAEDKGEPPPSAARRPLPSFDSNVTLDQIKVPKTERPPSESAAPAAPAAPGDEDAPAPTAGQTGFGENTLMWMQPAKVPPGGAQPSPPVGQDSLFEPPSPAARRAQVIRWAAAALVLVVVVAGLAFGVGGGERGALELHTNPSQATLFIDGELSPQKTPVKLTLNEGGYDLRLEKEGFETQTVRVEVEGGQDARKDVDLVPVSRPGLLTVAVRVSPIAATITVNEETHNGVRLLHVPNLDPTKEHRIRVEASGYLKTEQIIQPGELKESYEFVLEPDSAQ